MSPDECNRCKFYCPAGCWVSKTTTANIHRGLVSAFKKQDASDFIKGAVAAMRPNGCAVCPVFNGPVTADQLPSVGVVLQVGWHGNVGLKKSLCPRFDIWAFAHHHDFRGILVQHRIQRQAFDFVVLGANVVVPTCRSLCQFGGSYP